MNDNVNKGILSGQYPKEIFISEIVSRYVTNTTLTNVLTQEKCQKFEVKDFKDISIHILFKAYILETLK